MTQQVRPAAAVVLVSASDTVDLPRGPCRAYIGSSHVGATASFSVITVFCYWPSRLTNSDLPVISA